VPTTEFAAASRTGEEDEVPSGGLSRRRRIAVGVVFVFVATVFQLLRQPGMAMWRTAWAEDVGAFYEGAIDRPLHEIIFEGYAGYGHVLPRILAAIGEPLPVEWYASYATVSACLIVSALALFVYYASAPLLRSPVRQGLLAFAMVGLPVLIQELVGSIANLHWYVPLACFFAVAFPVERGAAIGVRSVIALLSPLTSPLSLVFVPLALLRGWQAWRGELVRRALIVPVVYLVGVVGQGLMILSTAMPPEERPPLDDLVVNLAKLYSTRVITSGVFGVRVTDELWGAIGYGSMFVAVAVVGTLVVLKLRTATAASRAVVVGLLGASAAIYGLSMYQRGSLVPALLSSQDGDFNFGGTRYEVFPVFLVLTALLISNRLEWADLRAGTAPAVVPLRADAARNRTVLAIAAVWLAVAFVPSYRIETGRALGPDWPDSVRQAREQCRIDPDLNHAVVRFSPPPLWAIAIPCTDLDVEADRTTEPVSGER
jgi:hypothetical protein